MDVTFKSKKLEKIFNSEKLLVKEFGSDNAKKIRFRMAVLYSAPDLSKVPSLPPDRCHELEGDRKGQFAVDLKQPYRLIFRPLQGSADNKEKRKRKN